MEEIHRMSRGPTVTARKIVDGDTVKSIEAARYRFSASLADLERHYDAEASKLRSAFIAEVAGLYRVAAE
jgi:hypothetical protein